MFAAGVDEVHVAAALGGDERPVADAAGEHAREQVEALRGLDLPDQLIAALQVRLGGLLHPRVGGVPEFIGDDVQALVLPDLPLALGLLDADRLLPLLVPRALDSVGDDLGLVVPAVEDLADASRGPLAARARDAFLVQRSEAFPPHRLRPRPRRDEARGRAQRGRPQAHRR